MNNCQQVQADVAAALLKLNHGSQFQRDHGLHAVRSAEEMRRVVPVTNYENYRPYIDRLKNGDEAALLGEQNRLMMFTLSSGTTSDSKFIPVTNRFYSDYRRSWQLWGIAAFDSRPLLTRLKVVQIVSDYNRFQTDGRTPCGSISGLAAAMQNPIVRLLYTVPYEVTRIDDATSRYYTILRLAIADADVGMVTTANPSTLVHLAQLANEYSEELIRDVFDGTLRISHQIPAEVRKSLSRRLARRQPERARFLERCVEQHGTLSPRHFWPDLQLMAVWTGGSCVAYLPALREHYGEAAIRDHGLSASEGRMTIPFADGSPDGVLDIASHFYEFIPEAEYGQPDPTVLQAHELEADQNYFILLTTASGFYRYDICDVVRCVGFQGNTPILRFLHKGAHISSITGEKLSESQVVEAVRLTLGEFQHQVDFFTLIPSWGDPPGYRLMLEQRELPSAAQNSSGGGFEARLDERLCELNYEYRDKRSTSRLAPVRILALKDGSWTAFARERQQKLGGTIEQYKHPCLLPNLETAAQVASSFAASPD